MSKTVTVFLFHLLETVEVQLSDKALKFWMSKEFGKNFGLDFFLIKNINQSAGFVPRNNVDIGRILRLEKVLLREWC